MDEIRLGDVLARVRRPLEIDPVAQYRQIGIRSHGRGVFHKEPVSGAALGSKRVFLIEPGDLVVNIVFAWEGAVAVADEGELGMCGSHRFPTFRPIDKGCDVRYIREAPIADINRNTFKLFGEAGDPGYVMNQYSMERSISDGATVPLHVETRLVDYHIDRDALDQAEVAMAEEEGLTDEERDVLAQRATSAKAFALNPARVRAVCADIVNHFIAKVDPLGMKAQIVALDRELCVVYHEEITRLLSEGGSDAEAAVVMTVGTAKGEPPEWRERYELTPEAEAALKARFLDHGDPLGFLIVTAKLLAGFDAPIEGVMYLDRPLRLHTLFQAICRTNRRWSNPVTGQEKHYGLIVDYVGLGAEIARSLRAADPERGGRRPVDVEGLLPELEAALETALTRFDGIDRSDFTFAALAAAQDRVPPGERRDEFAREFLTVHHLWEFLDPNPALTAFRGDYRWLAQVYESVQPTGVSDALLWHRLGAKTLELVHGHITDLAVSGTGLDEVIVDAETIEAIRQLALPAGASTSRGLRL